MAGARLTVLTWNLYCGASVYRVAAGGPAGIAAGVAAAWAMVQATDFAARAEAISGEIAAIEPDVVGLQEVAHFQVRPPAPPGGAALPTASLDFLGILGKALASRGLDYRVAALADSYAIEMPSATGELVRIADRNAILVRREVPWSRPTTGRFEAASVMRIGPVALDIHRSWAAVDLGHAGGAPTRFVTTHLDPDDAAVQLAQVLELERGAARAEHPVVLTGDFNSRADSRGTETYQRMLEAGFVDAWLTAGESAGFTGVQGEDLRHPESRLDHRIDFVLTRGAIRATLALLMGTASASRTPSGLWPSDHAGVAATLEQYRVDPPEGNGGR